MNPFEFINDINFGKKNLFKDDDKNIIERDYNSFIINRGLSYFVDTVLLAFLVLILAFALVAFFLTTL